MNAEQQKAVKRIEVWIQQRKSEHPERKNEVTEAVEVLLSLITELEADAKLFKARLDHLIECGSPMESLNEAYGKASFEDHTPVYAAIDAAMKGAV